MSCNKGSITFGVFIIILFFYLLSYEYINKENFTNKNVVIRNY
jgi:hypothetical protein